MSRPTENRQARKPLIALTGATGFIGQYLLKELPKRGYRLRVLLRRDAAAWVALGAVWALISLPSWQVSVVQWICTAVSIAIVVSTVRVGLVAATVGVATANLLTTCTPLTLDFSRWYAWRTLVIAGLLLAIAVWGFRAAMGRRRILSAAMLEG